MPIAETVILTIAPSIAKTILKRWLHDDDMAQSVGDSLIDLFAQKVPSILARNRGERQFQEIGEKVAENLVPIFERSSIDDSGKEAVAHAVARTLGTTRIDAKLLLSNDLDPVQLTDILIDSSSNEIAYFSQAETELFRRVINKSSEYIVDISSGFPSFSERSIAELLQRDSSLSAKVDEIIERMKKIEEETRRNNTDEDSAQFEEDYRNAVIRNLDKMELFGVSIARTSGDHSLSIAYVNLFVTQKYNSGYKSVDPHEIIPLHHRGFQERHAEPTEGYKPTAVSVERVISDSRRLLVRGSAGSGKTTLLKWIAVNVARRQFLTDIDGRDDLLPFYIPLRRCVDVGLPAPEEFPRFVAPLIHGKMPAGWVHSTLESGRSIILVDSVDEVPQSQRARVRRWLEELGEAFPNIRLLVTSRPSAIEEGWLNARDFTDTELLPMELSDIIAFIDHWHTAVRQQIKNSDEKVELELQARKMVDEIEENIPIRSLAANPLLCSALCALNRDRHRNLPSDKIELYEALCGMLLERRDKERQLVVESRDYPKLSLRQKKALLHDFAYWMMRNGWSTVSVEQADERLALKLKSMVGILQSQGAVRVRRLFVDRTGILQEPTVTQVDFAHRTLQEYLTAQALASEGDLGVLLEHAKDDLWREVVIIASGLISLKARDALLSQLIEIGDNDPPSRHQLHLLAVACLENAVELSEGVRSEVSKRLSRLVPPHNMTEARAIASAGQLAIPYLRRGAARYSTDVAACVRALALIGGDAALESLKAYAGDERQTVQKEVLRAVDSFNRDTYFREVIARMGLTRFDVDCRLTLVGMHWLTSLEFVRLWNADERLDLNPLSGLTKLREIYINVDGGIPDISPISKLPELKYMNLSDSGSYYQARFDISSLALMENLELLSISVDRKMEGVESIRLLKKLESFYLRCRSISSLSFLSGMESLLQVNVYARSLPNKIVIENLPNVQYLSLDGASSAENADFLLSLPSVSNLCLEGFEGLGNIEAIASLQNIKSLVFYGMEKLCDFSAIAKIKGLECYVIASSDSGTDVRNSLQRYRSHLGRRPYSRRTLKHAEEAGLLVYSVNSVPQVPLLAGKRKLVISV